MLFLQKTRDISHGESRPHYRTRKTAISLHNGARTCTYFNFWRHHIPPHTHPSRMSLSEKTSARPRWSCSLLRHSGGTSTTSGTPRYRPSARPAARPCKLPPKSIFYVWWICGARKENGGGDGIFYEVRPRESESPGAAPGTWRRTAECRGIIYEGMSNSFRPTRDDPRTCFWNKFKVLVLPEGSSVPSPTSSLYIHRCTRVVR